MIQEKYIKEKKVYNFFQQKKFLKEKKNVVMIGFKLKKQTKKTPNISLPIQHEMSWLEQPELLLQRRLTASNHDASQHTFPQVSTAA